MHLRSNLLTFIVLILFSGLIIWACSRQTASIGNADIQVSNFGLIDQNGDFYNLYYHSDAVAVVLFVHGNGCPVVRNAISDFKSIRDKHEDVQFFMVNSNLQDNRESIAKEAKEYEIDFPIFWIQ